MKLETVTVSEDVERTETVETEVSSSPLKISLPRRSLPLATIVYKPKGEAIAQIVAPVMGLDSIVVSGTAVVDLQRAVSLFRFGCPVFNWKRSDRRPQNNLRLSLGDIANSSLVMRFESIPPMATASTR